MNKKILVACLCATLILITTFTVIAQENKVISNLIEESDVEGLVAQLRIVTNEILHKYGYNPMVAYLCNYILGIIDDFIFGVVCILLLIILIPVAALTILLSWILGDIVNPLLTRVAILVGTWDLECASFFNDLSIRPLRTISTLTETNDISNLENDCPCLQG